MIDLLEDELQYTYTTVNKLDYMIHKQLLSRVPKKSASPCLFVQKYIYNTIHTYIYYLYVCFVWCAEHIKHPQSASYLTVLFEINSIPVFESHTNIEFAYFVLYQLRL